MQLWGRLGSRAVRKSLGRTGVFGSAHPLPLGSITPQHPPSTFTKPASALAALKARLLPRPPSCWQVVKKSAN